MRNSEKSFAVTHMLLTTSNLTRWYVTDLQVTNKFAITLDFVRFLGGTKWSSFEQIPSI